MALLRAARRSVVLAVVMGLALGVVRVPADAAESSVPNGAFACAGAPPADARLTTLVVTPEVVTAGAGAVTLVFGLDVGVLDPPVVTLATQDGTSSTVLAAVPDPAGWRVDLAIPEDALPAELGVTISWVDGQATPCGLRARGLPSVVAVHPLAPAAPTALSAAGGDGLGVLTWARGADGDAPLTGYEVTAHPGAQVWHVSDPSAQRAVLHGLTNGVAYAFDVVAANAAGSSPAVRSAAIVPRRRLVLGAITPAALSVTYGAASVVTAAVRDAAGSAAAGVPVELYARQVGTTTWRSVARASSGSTGVVRLRAVLTGSSALAVMHHPDASLLSTTAVGTVSVRSRVTASPSHVLAGAAYVQQVTGTVGPGGPVGSTVQLQRYVSGGWHGVVNGLLITSTTYRIRWTPAHAGRYQLRVVRPATGALLTGLSRTFTVDAIDTRISVAREVLADHGTWLATSHLSGVSDLADARRNVVDTAQGRAARRSSYGNAPGGSVLLDLRTLRLLRRIGQLATVTVTEVSGGSHSAGSLHYAGRAIDVSVVNGAAVRRGSDYLVVVRACQAAGASQVFYPAHDPYGGHQGHVHCAFG